MYDEIGEGGPVGNHFPRPGELRDCEPEITASGLFDVVHVRHFDWGAPVRRGAVHRLAGHVLRHIAMAGWHRERLYGAIRDRLADRPDGTLRRHWGAVPHIARRRDEVADQG